MAKVDQPCSPPPGDEGSIALGAGGNPSDVVLVQNGAVVARCAAGVWTFGSGKGLITSVAGALTTYNGVALTGFGLPVLVAKGREAALTARTTSNSTYTVGAADATFMVLWNVTIVTSGTFNFNATATWTNEANVAASGLQLDSLSTAGQYSTAIANAGGAVAYAGRPVTFRAKAGSVITVNTNAGTYTSVTYNMESFIYRID